MNSQEYYLNIRPGEGYPQTVKVSQGDVGRPLLFHLMDGVTPLTIAAGSDVVIHATKPSGLGFTESCTVTGSAVSVSSTIDMTQEFGLFPAEIVVTLNDEVLATANFSILVERSPHPEGTTDGVAEDLQDIYEQLDDLKSDIEQLDGLSEDVKQALLAIAQNVVYTNDDEDYYQNLYDALYPPAELVSISAVYTQSGTVYDTDTLNSLKADLVVTATYDDSSTAVVTAYTLSGTLTAGTSTVTVTYNGKTTTFTVNVTAYYVYYDYLEGDGTAFINTDLNAKEYAKDTYSKYIKVRLNEPVQEIALFGARNQWGATGVLIQGNITNFRAFFANANTEITPVAENGLYEIELTHPSIKYNGETYATVSGTTPTITSTTATLALFGVWGGSSPSGDKYALNGGWVSQFCPHKIYRFKITEISSGDVIADMKPAIRSIDSAVGMYDSVRNRFFVNARDTGTLAVGNDT